MNPANALAELLNGAALGVRRVDQSVNGYRALSQRLFEQLSAAGVAYVEAKRAIGLILDLVRISGGQLVQDIGHGTFGIGGSIHIKVEMVGGGVNLHLDNKALPIVSGHRPAAFVAFIADHVDGLMKEYEALPEFSTP